MKNITTLTIKVNVLKISTGHRVLCSGAGKHLDKRTKRQRTRSAAFRAALKD